MKINPSDEGRGGLASEQLIKLCWDEIGLRVELGAVALLAVADALLSYASRDSRVWSGS